MAELIIGFVVAVAFAFNALLIMDSDRKKVRDKKARTEQVHEKAGQA